MRNLKWRSSPKLLTAPDPNFFLLRGPARRRARPGPCPPLSRDRPGLGGGGWRPATPTRRLGPRTAACGQRLRRAALGSSRPSPSAASRARAAAPRARPEPRRTSDPGPQLGATWGRGARRPRLSRATGSGRAGLPDPGERRPPRGRLAGLGTEILTKECRPQSRERAPGPARAPAGHKLHTHACLSERFPRAERWACKAGRAARSRVGAHGGAPGAGVGNRLGRMAGAQRARTHTQSFPKENVSLRQSCNKC